MVGFIAPVLRNHGLLPLMARGSFSLTISGTFADGAKGWLPYFVSKRALEDLSIGLAHELQAKGVNIHCISPSDTATDAYKRFFPQFLSDAVHPDAIGNEAMRLYSAHTPEVVWVVKQGVTPYAHFHE